MEGGSGSGDEYEGGLTAIPKKMLGLMGAW